MALDKLVDSTQLNADLTSVANAIRTKGGTAASLAFPAGFVSAVEAIETGGGAIDLFDPDSPAGAVISTFSGNISSYGCAYRTAITSIHLINAKLVGQYGIVVCSALTTFVGELVKSIANYGLSANTQLTTIDILGGDGVWDRLFNNAFNGNTVFNTLIIRTQGVQNLSDPGAFRNTPFASGGSGGTIYIHKALYDHLGDGSALDYKAATNWSTILGYANNQILPIEGSIYETQYADGTPIAA